MVAEAVENMQGQFSNAQIRQYIKNKWPGTNRASIDADIITMTVNHESRIHYTVNYKPRLTNSGSVYDLLYRTRRGYLEKYNESVHGLWEIVSSPSQRNTIRQVSQPASQPIYTPSDIRWIKNISNAEIGRAYLDVVSDSFVLHFPTHHKGNVLSPAIDDIILLYQKINGESVFTHLVTPINNKIDETSQRAEYLYGREVRIIAMTSEANVIPVKNTLWKDVTFSGISQGNACEIEHIGSVNSLQELQLNTWEQFEDYFVGLAIESRSLVDSLLDDVSVDFPEMDAIEGKVILVSHFARERNRALIDEKKRQALLKNEFHCEVCSFSFQAVYGKDFLECHHIFPIGKSGIRRNSLDDLALVCSNCHRMLHTKFENEYLSIAALAERIKTRNL